MAWRPYENLIDGELDNRIPGIVSGWMHFFRRGHGPLKVVFILRGDFHEDIRGKVIRLKNPEPSDRNEQLDRKGTYMEGFSLVQRGDVGDITAGLPVGPWTKEVAQKLMAQNELFWDKEGLQGLERDSRRQEYAERYRKHVEAGHLFYPYGTYPYIEWYSGANGRVVLELEPSQVEIIGGNAPRKEKTPRELVGDELKRIAAMSAFLGSAVTELSEENRKNGGDGNVFGALFG